MNDLPTSDIRFDGVGATAGTAGEAARVLAAHLNHWSADHPNARILQLSIQSAAAAGQVELTAILAYIEEATIREVVAAVAAEELPEVETPVTAVILAEEIVADAQQEQP